MAKKGKLWLITLTFFAAALRIHGLFANTFYADEALFASWAKLIAVWRDPLLQSQLIDKPPLLFYLQALFFPLFGPVEFAARMPNLIASIMLIPVTAIFAWELFHNEITAVLAAAFVTFSPMAIQYSSTAFTDPLLTFLMTLALAAGVWAANHSHLQTDLIVSRSITVPLSRFRLSRTLLAGLVFGLALLTKYQAILFLPALMGLVSFLGWRWIDWRRWLLGLTSMIGLLVIWDFVRSGRFSLIGAQMTSYGGLRLSWSWELWQRLEAWGQQWRFLMDSQILIFALVLTLPLFLALLIYHQDKLTAIDQILVIYLLGYFAVHWLLAIPIWDRYILPILPLVGILLGRFVWRVFTFALPLLSPAANKWLIRKEFVWFVPIILLALQGQSVIAAYEGKLPIGGRPEADNGASQIANSLYGAAYGTVLYDHWYSWQWRYHLFDSRVYINWFPNPDSLVEDLAVFWEPENERYIVLPEGPASVPVVRAITKAGYKLNSEFSAGLTLDQPPMALYRISKR